MKQIHVATMVRTLRGKYLCRIGFGTESPVRSKPKMIDLVKKKVINCRPQTPRGATNESLYFVITFNRIARKDNNPIPVVEL